ncbi:hypothetical protein BV22DRAFT_1037821 [Leucogyrophana mollusca]|uniref:Uncharacterized protein n=1 Tax=Leucogyrophana mollusca TaxID=85980 RepID=A0ACB8B8H7_9AGAM|nr:hypothetical protein BV22DRAFT_1037821 [Leucogyrophana mollusca]
MDAYVYSASCNPPRRAKRLRSDSESLAVPQAQTQTQARFDPPSIAPQPSNPSSSSQVDEGNSPTPAPPPPAPKRRGRKPGVLSRAAREAQRKINHSLIEKARRTKINEALAALRGLVPVGYERRRAEGEDSRQKKGDEDKHGAAHEYGRSGEASDDDSEDEVGVGIGGKKDKDSGKKGKPREEKEFKLEILVRTVAYLQDLRERVQELEGELEVERAGGRSRVRAEDSGRVHAEDGGSLKRKRGESGGSLERKRTRNEAELEGATDARGESSRASTAEPTRLPSISTWLPRSGKERNGKTTTALLLSGHSSQSQSPSLQPLLNPAPPSPSKHPAYHHQLPTPPTSESLPPASAGFPLPPVLTLPSPSAFGQTLPSPRTATLLSPSTRFPDFFSRGARAGDASSPVVSPVYSPEDESAASLLLQISTSPLLQTSSRKSLGLPREKVHERNVNVGEAMTPGKLLGLSEGG